MTTSPVPAVPSTDAEEALPTYDWPADLMTVAQVASIVLLTPKTVRVHIRAGRLRAVRFGTGGGYRVRAEDAQAWVAAHVVQAEARLGVDAAIARRRRSALAGAHVAARPDAWSLPRQGRR